MKTVLELHIIQQKIFLVELIGLTLSLRFCELRPSTPKVILARKGICVVRRTYSMYSTTNS